MAAENAIIDIHSVESWNEHLQKGKDSKKLVVVDFTATWCGPCKFIMPLLESLAEENPEVTFLKVDVDKLASVVKEFEIRAVPTIIFFKEGKILDKTIGASKPEIAKKVAELSAL